MRIRFVLMLMAGCGLLMVAPPAAQKKPRAVDVPGAAVIRCLDANDGSTDAICGDGAVLAGDGGALYADTEDDVQAIIRSHDLGFALRIVHDFPPATRAFTIRFPATRLESTAIECVGESCFADDLEPLGGRVITTHVVPASKREPGENAGLVTGTNSIDGGLPGMTPGTSVQSSFLIGFPDPDSRGFRWAVYFNDSIYPGTGQVTVTRDSLEPCTWTIEADEDDVAGLILFQVAKGVDGRSHEGRFNMPFRIVFRSSTC